MSPSNRSSGGGRQDGGSNRQNGRQAGAKNTSGDDKNRRRRKSSRKKKKVDPLVFWGDPAKLAEHTPPQAQLTTRPSAVVESLGRPPLSGQQHSAEHYFAAVYDRAVNLAGALAAAGRLIDPEDLLDGDRSGR